MMSKPSRLMRSFCLAGAVSFAAAASISPALAWGSVGHRIIGTLAIETLPASLPGFLRSKRVAADVGEWAREPDRWRGAGRVHDDMRDPGHYIDVMDNGRTFAGVRLAHLPPTRADYAAMLVHQGESIDHTGYLPYNIVDGYQQLTKDFAIWRADKAALKYDHNPGHHAWLVNDFRRREEQTIMDIGIWGHYVGDGSQPLHVSVHYNGWGHWPNPHHFTNRRIHVPFEGPFVAANVSFAAVRAAMTPQRDCGCAITMETAHYLDRTLSQVAPLYRDYKRGGLQPGNRAMVGLATKQVAAGASELRDLIVAAWNASASATFGYPAVSVREIERGKVYAWPILH
jgi:hypothetical protein